MHGTIAMLNSTTSLKTEGFGGIRPTELERRYGRIMRGPDHDAGGDGAGDAGSDAGADKGADAGADKGAEAGADGGSDAGESGAGDNAGDDDSSVLGGAKSEAGEGDGGKDGEGDGEGGKDDKGQADGPPETYELKITTKGEDGKDVEVELDTELLAEATPVLKELGLSNEAANKLAPFILKAQDRFAARQNDDFAAMKTQWAKDAEADKEIGGAKWAETKALAAKALDAFGAKSEIKEVDGKKVETNPFRALLNETGLGNHPVMIRMFREIGAKIGEDTDVARTEGSAKKKDSAEILYPDDVPKK